jgi:RNA polymerase sigma factor (sigma-70 family)
VTSLGPPVQPGAIAEDLFRRGSVRLVAALTRLLGPAHLALAEDVVQDALVSALSAWQIGVPGDPEAWIIRTAHHRAIDTVRRDRNLARLLEPEGALSASLEHALSANEDAENQLAMMFSCCHEELSEDTRVTLILRFLCGLGPREIARAFLVDTQTIDRRIHRGRERLVSLGRLHDVEAPAEVSARLPSVHRALYLLFNEGFHGSEAGGPSRPSMCAEALRLTELLLGSRRTSSAAGHALAALICFHAARLGTRLDEGGVFVQLSEQDRTRWGASLIERGIVHLGESASGPEATRLHLEAGIACEHALAPSIEATNWARIVALYDMLLARSPGPVVALNRALALAELEGFEAGRAALAAIGDDRRLIAYPFYWAALADLARRAGHLEAARQNYARAIAVARNHAERLSYERKVDGLA